VTVQVRAIRCQLPHADQVVDALHGHEQQAHPDRDTDLGPDSTVDEPAAKPLRGTGVRAVDDMVRSRDLGTGRAARPTATIDRPRVDLEPSLTDSETPRALVSGGSRDGMDGFRAGQRTHGGTLPRPRSAAAAARRRLLRCRRLKALR
jgi:hypothetical protein